MSDNLRASKKLCNHSNHSNFTRCIDSVPMQELSLQASESKFQISRSGRDVITEHKYLRRHFEGMHPKEPDGFIIRVINKTIDYC